MGRVKRFGPFEADLSARQLRKRGVRINLRDQSFEVLASLLEHGGEVVTRAELRRRLWPDDVFVEFENNLNTAVARLREALCDSAGHPIYIETLPRRGYRFLASVSEEEPRREESPARIRLLVLPFVDMGGNGAEDYFSDAMTDEIITALASGARERVAVIARTTAMRYKGTRKDVAHIGRELEVDYVLEGGVRREGDRVVINVQLIESSEQVHVFARRYEAGLNEVWRIQTEVAEDAMRHIPGLPSQIPFGNIGLTRASKDPVAHQLYLQGRQHMYREMPQELVKAKECFTEALARDPRFALAYDGLGEAHFWTGFFGYLAPKEAFAASLWAALRALEIDNTLAETHALLGQLRQQLDYNWPEVRRELDYAMDLDPWSPLVRFRYAGSGLLPQGRVREGITHLECALKLDPLSPLLHCWLSVFLWPARDFEAARRAARCFEELYPDSYIAQMMIGHICRDMGRLEEAIAAQRRAVEWSGGAPQMAGWLGFSLALAGESAKARSLLERLCNIDDQAYVAPTSVAFIHLGLGEIDETFRCLERAIEDRDAVMIPIKSYPFLDSLREDPRFANLLRKMNLEPVPA